MFWTFIIFASLASVFVKLGAYSVWMAILSGGLKLAIAVIVCMVVWMIFRSVIQKPR
jgi:chromate transport protein ChrA